ncbi:hypothetical protein GO986_21960 [Deinococcus sp. HMF7620]|uniref:Uncharacterized protein n=1 Tax=Deinococcus arboris TaxID=2682977 RepID=A0A7C9M4W7_9DEIO|nr:MULTISPECIES: hypothetical protein [Deinococcus]MBZ9752835.1 hypothetical protein [Deinococcus betulae]MVN89402.1 hypothetical protein [Deinococcus arboris]
MARLILELTNDTHLTFEASDDWVTQAAQRARSVQGEHNRMFWFTDPAVRPSAGSVSGILIHQVKEDLDT